VELGCVTTSRPERAHALASEVGVAHAVADFKAVLAHRPTLPSGVRRGLCCSGISYGPLFPIM